MIGLMCSAILYALKTGEGAAELHWRSALRQSLDRTVRCRAGSLIGSPRQRRRYLCQIGNTDDPVLTFSGPKPPLFDVGFAARFQ